MLCLRRHPGAESADLRTLKVRVPGYGEVALKVSWLHPDDPVVGVTAVLAGHGEVAAVVDLDQPKARRTLKLRLPVGPPVDVVFDFAPQEFPGAVLVCVEAPREWTVLRAELAERPRG